MHPTASMEKQKVDIPDPSNYLNFQNDGGKNAYCYAAIGHNLLTSGGVADTYTVWLNTWNTLPVRYQQRVYTNNLSTVKCQIQLAENPTPAVVITVEAGHIDNAIRLDNLTSQVALEAPDIGSTD
jgi:hypothetical protein